MAENCDKIWIGKLAHEMRRRKDGVCISDMVHSCKLKKGHKGPCHCPCALMSDDKTKFLPKGIGKFPRNIISVGINEKEAP